MHSEQIIFDSVLALWKSTVDRATKLFDDLSEEDAAEPVAPGRNRVVYLLGHLTAVHDRMIPLLGLGKRIHPEMDASFVSNPDRAGGNLPPLADLKNRWEAVNGHLLVLMQQDVSPSWWAQRHTSVSEAAFQINPTKESIEYSPQQDQPFVISLRPDHSGSKTAERIGGSQNDESVDRNWPSFRRSLQVAIDSVRMANRTVLITGASSGVGIAALLSLAEQGRGRHDLR